MRGQRYEESAAAAVLQNEMADDGPDAGIRLRCPVCLGGMRELNCMQCGLQLRVERGVVRALTPHGVGHYAQFIADYERIRDAEGRGSKDDDFYLNLPYCDVTGKNSDQWQIRSCSYVCLMEEILAVALPSGARILDLGAGNGWLSFRLALAGYSPTAVDLMTNERDGLEAAEHYRRPLLTLFPRFQAELGNLPFQDGQFDAAIFNASFHYIEDDEGTVREALRCVKDDGLVIVCDTPWYSSEESGRKMVAERREHFKRSYGTDSSSLRSIEYLTDDRLRRLEERLSIRWSRYSPSYGLRWAMRPLVAKLRRRREPARFRIYVAQKASA